MSRRPLATAAVLAMSIIVAPGTVAATAEPAAPQASPAGAERSTTTAAPDGSFTLIGRRAAAYRTPDDVEKVWSTRYPDGSRQTRYQQVVANAEVLGGQTTVFRNAAGRRTSVVGSHYATLQPTNRKRLSLDDSLRVAGQVLGVRGERSTTLRIDPRDGALFYEVDTRRFAARPVLSIDAQTGAVRNRFDALAEGGGCLGLKGDTKTIDTSGPAGAYRMIFLRRPPPDLRRPEPHEQPRGADDRPRRRVGHDGAGDPQPGPVGRGRRALLRRVRRRLLRRRLRPRQHVTARA